MKLIDYIRGKRKGKEAHRLERESMQDPFLADAIDGYDTVEGNHEVHIDDLRKMISHKSGKRRTYAVISSIAASLLIGIGISFYFIYESNRFTEKIYTEKKDTTNVPVNVTVPVTQPEPITKRNEAIAQNKDTVKSIPVKPPKKSPRLLQEESSAPTTLPETVTDEIETISQADAEAMEIQVDIDAMPSASAQKVRKEAMAAVAPQAGMPRIRGKVVGENGEPVIGANVTLNNDPLEGTVTDSDGNFELTAQSKNDKLKISYIGLETVETPIDTAQEMMIAMNPDRQELSEVVVTGYSEVNKRLFTGAVDTTDTLSKPKPIIGIKAYKKYIKENLQLPTDDKCKGIEGKVIVTFNIGKDGKPQDITIKQSLCEAADAEAIRLIEKGPLWSGKGKTSWTVEF